MVKRLSSTARRSKFLASFVLTCKLMLQGFFWIIGIRKCSISATVAPGKLRTLTGLSFSFFLSSITPLMIESATMAVIPLG